MSKEFKKSSITTSQLYFSIKKKKVAFISFFLAFGTGVLFNSCSPSTSPEPPEPKKISTPKIQDSLGLKQHQKITLKYWQPQNDEIGNKAARQISIITPVSAEGISFNWTSSPGETTIEEPSNYPSGLMSLPNLSQSDRMTLPIFWPEGELYLANSSGIWLSDQSFAQLKEQGKTKWQLGLLKNPLLINLENSPFLKRKLKNLPNKLAELQKSGQTIDSEWLTLKKTEAFPLQINGKQYQVKVLVAENDLASLRILDLAQNPIILEVQLGNQSHWTSSFLSPFWELKAYLDYQVTEIQLP